MKILSRTQNDTQNAKKYAVALGFFDGVHEAHREIIKSAMKIAKEKGLSSAVFTFPTESVMKTGAERLYSTEEKLSLLENLGVDTVFLCPLSEIKEMSAEEFVKFLYRDLGCEIAVAGYNFRFAKGASASADDLRHLMRENGACAVIVPPYGKNGDLICSTGIRKLLSAGEIEKANRELGLPYSLGGYVEHGRGFGHTFGIPTVNLSLPDGKILPKSGVYLSYAVIDGTGYPSLTDVGTCPTFGKRENHSETFIFGLNHDIYGAPVRVFLLSYLREEAEFPDGESLKMQITVDIEKAKELHKIHLTPGMTLAMRAAFKGDTPWVENGHN